MKITFKEILKYYWPHVVAYKWSVSLGILTFGFGGVLASAITPLLYKRIIDVTSVPMNAGSLDELTTTLIFIAIAVVGYNILFRIADFVHSYAQSNILKRLSDETFARIGNHSQAFFSETFVGSLVAKSKRYVDSFETLHDAFAFNIWMNGITLIATFGILLWLAPLLAIIFIVWLVFYILITVWFLKRKIPKDVAHATAQSATTGLLADTITNILTIKMFASFQREKDTFAIVTDDQERKRRATWYWDSWQRLFQGFAVALVEVSVIAGAVFLWSEGEITTGTIVLAQIYLLKLFDITWNIGRQIARTVQALNDAKEMIQIFKQPLSVKDAATPDSVNIENGEIVFDDVAFNYFEGKRVFKGLSLKIPAGQKVGLVGPSGAGKSTITKLILRFTDIDEGTIRIDGQDITSITQDELRSSIAYVPQEPILFHRSLRENIAYGKPDATDEEIVIAAKRAHAHEFIETLQNGYDTPVGERGVKLSGGERQRVAIARAMLKNAPILILDEATSSLDSISERHIQDALKELMKGRTTLVIAHRLSTVQDMDRILVFKEGAVIEDGTHTELSKNTEGVYHELWKEQSSGFIQ
ncbi:ABC transporter ATP-binding protein [Candidatus Kaiserbacteria bacterium]|nr:MAG: ABC transporter ATP-binding protein [Candidatus Kaiserbacteria bacterium]